MKKHKKIESILDNIDKSKYPPPENWLFTEARRLFTAPDVTPASEVDLKWEKPDEEALVAYMCGEKGFAEERIRNGCKKLEKARGGATQGRLDTFFKVSCHYSLSCYTSCHSCHEPSRRGSTPSLHISLSHILS